MQLYRAAPVGLVASLMVGVANGAFWGLAPLSAVQSGLGVGQVALLMGAAILGFLLWLLAASGLLLIGFALMFGALALPCYSLAAAHAYDKTPVSETVPTAATI